VGLQPDRAADAEPAERHADAAAPQHLTEAAWSPRSIPSPASAQ
jgi:hypothetical protein